MFNTLLECMIAKLIQNNNDGRWLCWQRSVSTDRARDRLRVNLDLSTRSSNSSGRNRFNHTY